MGKKQFCFFQTAETGNRTPDSGVKGGGANHYPRAPAHKPQQTGSLSYFMIAAIWTEPNSQVATQQTQVIEPMLD